MDYIWILDASDQSEELPWTTIRKITQLRDVDLWCHN